jgi:hypothetical protein
MKGFDLLSQIYKLLADVDLRAVQEARQNAGDGPVREILDAMASALGAKNSRAVAGEHAPATSSPKKARATKPANAKGARRGAATLSLSFVRESNPKRKTDELLRALRKAGLSVPMNPKDGSLRAIERAERLLSKMSADEADRTMHKLRGTLGIDETQGWINVIRSSP